MKKSKKQKKSPQAAPKEELTVHTEEEIKSQEESLEKAPEKEEAAVKEESLAKEASAEKEAEAATEEKEEKEEKKEELPAPPEETKPSLKVKKKKNEAPMSDEEAYLVLGPQSILGHMVQLVLAPIPLFSLLFTFLWISFGGTMLSVGLVSGAGALVLAVFAFWAFGGCTNVNRRRFARAYFLSLAVITAASALFVLLALSYGADLSPVLRRIINSISSLDH